ncbi:MAG: VTT domain-containing protein [SAR202 cluster bacterium]|jgi:membrane protein YqaA with SNARE-associated domain|nr:VTT domain-containing protein [SAR202 cluster bacterium]
MRRVARGRVAGITRLWTKRERRLPLLALVLGVGIAVTVWSLRGYISGVEAVGYPGVFFLSFLGSVAMVFPVPGLISVCGASVFLSPLLIGLIAGVGETIGEVSGYAIGYGGGTVVERRRFYPRLKHWMDTRGTLVIFLVSIIPNPVFDVVGIAAGGVRYPFTRFMVIVWVGKTIKGVMVAYTCYYGVTLLPWVE